MRRYITATALLAAGLCAGLPAGYLLRGDIAKPPQSDPNELQLTFKRDYFENLPKAPDGYARILKVATFTFDKNGDGTGDPDTSITIPLLSMNDIPDSQKNNVIKLAK